MQDVLGNFLCGGTPLESELAWDAKRDGEVSGSSKMTSGHVGQQIYGRERCEKKLDDGESGAGAEPLGDGGRRGLGVLA